MNYLAYVQKMNMKKRAILLAVFLLLGITTSAFAQSDPFGSVDRIYVDSVSAEAGNDVLVRFYMQNDEPISSLSIPLAYDNQFLQLKSVNFTGSRVEYIANKIMAPETVEQSDGHFLVSLFIMFEDAIPEGDGLLFSVIYNVSNSAPEGSNFELDTLFYPPGGEFILVEAGSSTVIVPEFVPGNILITGENFPPVISTSTSETVFEGDSLALLITANDPNNDSLIFVCSNKPAGSTFEIIDSKTALFRWEPDYVGPYSSDGSPFNLNIWVSDGNMSAGSEVQLNVVNKNRKPMVTADSVVLFESGDLVEFFIDGSDADFDPISWQIENLPSSAQFIEGSPAKIMWQTNLSDTGNFDMTFIVSDPQGYADSVDVALYLAAVVQYELSIDVIDGYPGDAVTLDINLDNKFPISSFELLINYDPSALRLLGIDNSGSRTSGFEYFTYTSDDNNIVGNVRIIGIADQSSYNTQYLDIGNGIIASFDFRIFGNMNLSGMSIPVKFVFLDEPVYNDNTFIDTLGQKIEQGAITYLNGSINVLSLGEVNIGDINLNGIPFDIGDAIYFTNYFMNPFGFPFNPLQYANSDVNRDNIAASIADFVALINVITEGGLYPPKRAADEHLYASVNYSQTNDGVQFNYDADFEVGGLLLTVKNGSFDKSDLINLTDNMTVDFYQDEQSTRILIYSLDGFTMPRGEYTFAQLSNVSGIEIISAELASSYGQMTEVNQTFKNVEIPDNFELFQNYPNPFNPETQIGFALPQNSKVELVIYNILGEKVKVLIDNEMTAGTHSVVWNGRNENGTEVSSGMYLYRLITMSNQTTKKMIFLK